MYVKKSKIAQNSLPVPCSLFPVPLPQRQFLTPTYLMVIDTSAIMAIIYAEPEELIFIELINESVDCLLSSPGYVEASIVLGTKHGQQGVENLNLLIAALSITIVPFTVEQAQLASAAFLKFGKGRHPAKLNMGDCFSYALAKSTN